MQEINRKLRVGIDMRMAGEGFGIGKYCMELAESLIESDRFKYVFFFDKFVSQKAYEYFLTKGVECHLLDAKYYSYEEQIKLPYQLSRLNLDLVHFTNFNVPIFYTKPFVVTIHDLIHHRFPGTSTRTLVWRLGYRIAINLAVRRAHKVIAVSENSKSDIISLLNAPPQKVDVIYEAVDHAFIKASDDEVKETLLRFQIEKPYILWVGVWRRYKNLERLAKAFSKLINFGHDLQLVLAGEIDKHHPEVAERIKNIVHDSRLVATGKVSERDLNNLYSGAEIFVNPSLSEGFGLTSLEAQITGTAVVASDIPVMREILGESALYFSPESTDQLIEQLDRILKDNGLKKELQEKSLENAKRFSWDETAKRTEKIYSQILDTNS